MTTLIVKELKKMLDLLDIDTLKGINNRVIVNPPYGYGLKPLLNYAPEALTEYATLIYSEVVERLPLLRGITDPHLLFTGIGDQYIYQWLSFYPPAEESFSSTSVDFSARLLDIAHTPVYPDLPPYMIIEDSEDVYKWILDYFDGELYVLYPQFNDFIYSKFSPLRRELTDQRLIDLINDADDLLLPYNEALESFIGQELKRLLRTVNDLLRFAKLNPKDLELLTNGKYPVATEVAQKLKGIIGKGSITATELAVVKQAVKEIKEPPVPVLEPVTTQKKPQRTLMPIGEYINHFIKELAIVYEAYGANQLAIRSEPIAETLESTFAYIYAVQIAKDQDGDLDSILAQQSKAEKFYLDFNNLEPYLRSCLQIDLNLIPVDKIFSATAQGHGIIQGLLEFTSKLKGNAKYRTLNLMYEKLAKELYKSMHKHTKGFATALPQPNIETFNKDAIETTPKAPRLDNTLLPFDLAPPIQSVLSTINADTITTGTEILSEAPDPETLAPIDSQTIKNIAYYLTGQPSVPYLMQGGLVIHNTIKDQYIKIVPTIRDDGYADYIFSVYNHSTLSNRILRLQRLIGVIGRSNEVLYRYEPLPNGNIIVRKRVLKERVELQDLLLRRVNELHTSIDTEVQAEIRQIIQVQYYSTIYLSAHKLSAYTYYPVEYSSFISAKPVDPETSEMLRYEVNHKDGCRSNNASENLEIISRLANQDLRSTSKQLIYNGIQYPTLKSYCESTEAGNYKNILQALSGIKAEVGPVTYASRIYTLDATGIITVTDTTDTPVITYGGIDYPTIKDFAEALSLNYGTVQKGINRARKANKTEYKHKGYQFYLGDSGITITKV